MMVVEPAGATVGPYRPEVARRRRLRLAFVPPAIGFIGLAIAFGVSLGRNPSVVPSALIGKPVPVFNRPPVKGTALRLSSADLKGAVSLVNVFASGCVACREEHPLLLQLSNRHGVPIYGIDYKDKPDNAARWLAIMGNPYARAGADIGGRVAIDWGVYGVPETYVIDRHGRVAFKQIGPVTPEILEKTILPLVEALQR